MVTITSIWMWVISTVLIVVWYPVTLIRHFFDRDPVKYRTGRLFRDLGLVITNVNPLWHIQVTGVERVKDPRRPYVMISNHQSMADIPIMSHLPWEMKWMAKRGLFKQPFLGWEMSLAGDIPVDRENPRSAIHAIRRARWYLDRNCSVMIFPEGTRSLDGQVRPFRDGAFRLAIDAGVPILPIAINGTHDCLPKKSWRFGKAENITIDVLPMIDTVGLKRSDVGVLRTQAREAVLNQLALRRTGIQASEEDS